MPKVSITKPSLLHKLIVDAGPQNVDILGLDNNQERVKSLVDQGYNCVYGDITDAQFDMIVAGEIIEHISDQAAFLSNISKLLKPGGTALISTPNPSGIMSALGYWLVGHERGGDGHVCWQAPKTIRSLAQGFGLFLEKTIHCYWDYPEPWMYLAWPFEIFPRCRPTLLFHFTKG